MIPYMIEGKVYLVNVDGIPFQSISGILNRENNTIACVRGCSFDEERYANEFVFAFDNVSIKCEKDGSAFFKIVDTEKLNQWIIDNTHEPYYISEGIKKLLKFIRII